MADIEMVSKEIQAITDEVLQKKGFSPSGLVAHMDNVFQKAGFRNLKSLDEPAEILVIRDDAAGDFVIFSPFLRELRRIYKGARITVVTSSRNHDLAVCCPYIDNIELNSESYDRNDTLKGFELAAKLAIRLLKYNFDMAFIPRLGIMTYGFLTAYLCGASQRIGFSNDRIDPTIKDKFAVTGWNVFLTVPVPFFNHNLNDVSRNLNLLEYLLKCRISKENRYLELWYSPEDTKKATEILKEIKEKKFRQYIAVVPVASTPRKKWPLDNYVEFLKLLLKAAPESGLVIMGGPNDIPVCEMLKHCFPDNAINVAGKGNFRISAAVMSQLNLYIGNDTGLMHIAAAAGLPILNINCFPAEIKLMSGSIPIRFAPYNVPNVVVMPPKALDGCNEFVGYGCSHLEKSHCINGVTVNSVWNGYKILMQNIKNNNLETTYIK